MNGRIYAPNVSGITVQIWENDIAWASYRTERVSGKQ
jgi:hypothetical protein